MGTGLGSRPGLVALLVVLQVALLDRLAAARLLALLPGLRLRTLLLRAGLFLRFTAEVHLGAALFTLLILVGLLARLAELLLLPFVHLAFQCRGPGGFQHHRLVVQFLELLLKLRQLLIVLRADLLDLLLLLLLQVERLEHLGHFFLLADSLSRLLAGPLLRASLRLLLGIRGGQAKQRGQGERQSGGGGFHAELLLGTKREKRGKHASPR